MPICQENKGDTYKDQLRRQTEWTCLDCILSTVGSFKTGKEVSDDSKYITK